MELQAGRISSLPKEARRDVQSLILDAAETVFAQRGFDGATTRAIAELAEVNLGLIHYHFSNKELLFERAVERRVEAINGRRYEMLQSVRQTPEGATLERIDGVMAERVDRDLNEHIAANWGGYTGFDAHGDGLALIIDGAIASAAYTSGMSSRQANISIITAPAFRGQGLATLTCAALIDRLVERLSDDGTLVLEMGIASAPGSEWVQVDRGIDTRAFPSMKKLHEVLGAYAWKWMGRSVAQAGDPVSRHVVHVSRRKPVAYLLMQPPGYDFHLYLQVFAVYQHGALRT